MTDDQAAEAAEARPLTYHQAAGSDRTIVDAQERYEALTDRKMAAQTVAILRERGEFGAGNPVHAAMAESEPLAAADWLEMMAAGEVLARYYRHPTMLDHAAKAGATWEQIGAARGTSAEQARRDYREWADGQHALWNGYGDGEHRFGLDDAEHGAAVARLDADPETYPGGIGDPANIGIRKAGGEFSPPANSDAPSPGAAKAYAETHRVLCAHADQDDSGAHWLEPGEKCPDAVIARLDAELEPGQ